MPSAPEQSRCDVVHELARRPSQPEAVSASV